MFVEVYADVSCPFTHVGIQRWLERRRQAGRDDVKLRVKAWPLELVNGKPLEGDFVSHEIDDLRRQIDASAHLFRGFRADRCPTTTLPALRLTSAGYAESDEVGEAVALALRDRLFERGEDVSDPAVLDSVAREHGLLSAATPVEPDPVQVEWDEGKGRGVQGSPHFFAAGIDVFCPSLRIERDGDHLRIENFEERFQRLCEASFDR